MPSSLKNPSLTYPWEKETDYEFCVLYDPSLLWSQHPAFEALVSEVFERAAIDKLIQAKSPKAVENAALRRRTELASLLWHLYLVHINQSAVDNAPISKSELMQQDPGLFDDDGYFESLSFPYVRVSLNKNDYKKSGPRNPFGITGEISKFLRLLEEAGLIEKKPGFSNRDGKIKKPGDPGKQTRFRPDNALEVLFEKLPPKLHLARTPSKPKPDVFKRTNTPNAGDSAKLKWKAFDFYPICPTLIENSSLIDRYNDFIAKSKIHVSGARAGYLVEPIGKGHLRLVDTSNIFIRNQYHVVDPGKITYGRLHGGFWQNMKSSSRHLIRIGGERVVILDYKAMILNIAAARHNAQLPDDPYEVEFGFGDKEKSFQRQMIKKAVIIAINCRAANASFQAMRKEFKDDLGELYGLPFKKDVFHSIINALTTKYPFLDRVFFKGIGKDIFMDDANIARDIIARFLDAEKVVLPIHDGFVVQESDRDFLRQTMNGAWKARFATDIMVDEE